MQHAWAQACGCGERRHPVALCCLQATAAAGRAGSAGPAPAGAQQHPASSHCTGTEAGQAAGGNSPLCRKMVFAGLAGRCAPQHSRLVPHVAPLSSDQSVRDRGALAGAASSASCPSKASAGGRSSCSPAAGRQASCRSSSCSCQMYRAPPDTGHSGCSGVYLHGLVGHKCCWPSVSTTSSPRAACLQAAALRLQQQQEEQEQLQRLRGKGSWKQQQEQQWWRRLTAAGPPQALLQDAAPSSTAQGQTVVDAGPLPVGSRPLLPPPSIVKGRK